MLLPQQGHTKASQPDRPHAPDNTRPPITLVIHGGAGNASPSSRDEAAYRQGMRLALAKGYAVLERGGSALDAVTAAVSAMEDDENFNAGRGAVFNAHGNIEMEASSELSILPLPSQSIPPHRRCMSATLLRHARNPIQLVRALYLNPAQVPHPYLSSSEAEVLGFKLHGSRPAPLSYFWTRRRWLEHRRGLGLSDDLSYLAEHQQETDEDDFDPASLPQGTVGAVALDSHGTVACATSTGGKTNKMQGRIGDTPTPGAGFWAEEWAPSPTPTLVSSNGTLQRRRGLAVSGTGDGDYFLRISAASHLAHRAQFLNEPLSVATRKTVDALGDVGGVGGFIGVDTDGTIAFALNSTTMNRAYMSSVDGAVPKTAIWADDDWE
ncbi:N-terminal nucleophile aminohydrolase [Ceraceosorus guamensis]|uniref:N-terminal nucleophile aminohydrolase n=1 Tax=Ceraceosorus guamensis TaxID=1522189 RepID=A0A316W1H0_9BASI|nr:N-terminal nucleophile aminohydrolase [Ceraceosorus guamensis]PWN43630.1 N-terminal nucleophile aminohydrolase [Ceraceosorus guamensis]